ncbi:MAG: acyltransferase [Candidatus Eremiobacteraeota bacterium]|nr:acyltransferase [Candidatus Eremiobacteraeota bacterium]MCW5871860.1 acyltransferase [Candidatus Eremiobacteraeota bacterium]
MSGSRTHFPSLDAIRTFACFFPISTHLLWEITEQRLAGLPWLEGLPMGVLAFLFGNGIFGVRLFMAMSGFLITYLMLRELKGTGRFSLRNFYVRRILRIWPAYFIVLGYMFWLFPGHLHERLWPYLLFLPNFELLRLTHTPGLYSNSQLSLLWSVGIEEQFYLIWPLVFVFFGVAGLRWGGVLFWLVAWASQFYFWNDVVTWSNHTVPCFLYISSGTLLGCAYHACPEGFERPLRALGYGRVVGLTLAFFVFMFGLGYLSLAHHVWLPIYGPFTAFFCCWLMISQIVYQGHRFSSDRIKPMVNFSKYTYGLYMYHRIVQWWLVQLFGRLGFDFASLSTLLMVNGCTLILACLASYLSFHTVEGYFMSKKHLFSPFSRPKGQV